MENKKADNRMDREGEGRKAKDVSAIPVEVFGQSLEMKPAKDQRKRDSNRDQASPHDQHVRAPPGCAPSRDEMVERELMRHPYKPHHHVAHQVFRPQEYLP